MYNRVIAHTCFMGHSGYANHAREFFTQLNELIPVSIGSSTYDPSTEMSSKQLEMLEKRVIKESDNIVHIVLETTDNPVFYANYEGPKIAYNVWESTRQPDEFFKKLLEYDQLWVPSEWQRECSIKQGYPSERVKVVREGVNTKLFTPNTDREGKFKFLVVGRWEYRKSTQEILQAFVEEFRTEDIELLCLVDNPFSVDGYSSTKERLVGNNFHDPRIKNLGFVGREEYVKLLQTCDCFVSCSRSEGWNLPLLEAISCGVPVIASNCSGQTEYLNMCESALKVTAIRQVKPQYTYPKGSQFPGSWYEPDFKELRSKLRYAYKRARHPININLRNGALTDSLVIQKEFTWEKAALSGYQELEKLSKGIATKPKKDTYFYTPDKAERVDLSDPRASQFSFTYKEVYTDKSYSRGPCRVEKGDVVIDCGANIGLFSRWAYEQGASKVYSFEAEKSNFEVLQKNLPNGNTFINAVNDKNELKELFIHTLGGSHSLEDNDINHTQIGKKQRVNGITLDTFILQNNIKSIDFLKIDTEGAELSIFKGLSDENLGKVSKIAMEYHNMIYDFDISLMHELEDRLKSNGFKVGTISLDPSQHLFMIYAYREEKKEDNKYIVHFVNGPFCEILGEGKEEYIVSFKDLDTGEIVHAQRITPNHWVRPNREYFTKWLVEVQRVFDGKIVISHEFNPRERRVGIWQGSKSLGDTLAWMPYLEEFRKKHNCKVYTATWWNHILKDAYPEIVFKELGAEVEDLYATYKIGVFDDDTERNKHREDYRSIPLQQVSSDILGISYKEIRPRVVCKERNSEPGGEYICIAEFSTARCKLWNRLNGWQELSDSLAEQGERVVSISKEPTGLGKNITRLNNRAIEDTISTLKGAKLFIGVSSGLAWLAWSLGIPVVLISGFTKEYCEFTTGVGRVINKEVCNGCFNAPEYSFDRGDWNWCPRDKDFECTKTITPQEVMEEVKLLLKE